MTTQAHSNSVWFSFIGDALALGPHWIYDQDAIQEKLPQPDLYHAPLTQYHPGKSAGDFTHYGDQTLLLLRSIRTHRGFDLSGFAAEWRTFWENPATRSYRDGATRKTLAHLKSAKPPHEAGSDSHDIGGAARIAPLFLLDWENDGALIRAAREQTAFTHNVPEVIDSAEFFTRVALAMRSRKDIPNALQQAAGECAGFSLAQKSIEAAQESAASDQADNAILHNYGLACGTEQAFPGIAHLLLRYPNDPATALVANAKAGGDSAARGLILGLVYGTKFTLNDLPTPWLNNLHSKPEIEQLLRQ